jgi:probable selenium-dependent hydroxylase accessory protein YqeC
MAESVLPEGKMQGFSPQTVEAVQSLGLFDWILVEADGAAHRPLKAPAGHEPVVPKATSLVLTVAGMWGVGKPLCSQWVFRPERFAFLAGMRLQDTIFPEHLSRVLVHPQGPLKASPSQSRNVLFLNLGSGHKNKRRVKEEWVQTVLEQTQAGYERRMSGWVDNRAGIQVMYKIYIG